MMMDIDVDYVISGLDGYVFDVYRVIQKFGKCEIAHEYDYRARGYLSALFRVGIIDTSSYSRYSEKLDSYFSEECDSNGN